MDENQFRILVRLLEQMLRSLRGIEDTIEEIDSSLRDQILQKAVDHEER